MSSEERMPWHKKRITIPLISRGPEIPPLSAWYRIALSMPRERLALFSALCLLFVISAVGIFKTVNDRFLVTVPASGGSLTEGVIGAPRFVNPLLAISQADHDLTEIIYAGLMKLSPDGTLKPELAERYEMSPDGLEYTFHLRQGLLWHDGKALSANDVVFTIHRAQDPNLKSPKRPSWEGVTVEALDSQTVRFHLSQPFASFLENATMGILPEHIWGSISSEVFPFSLWNSGAVGSGPYQVVSVVKDKLGIPLYYELVPFDHYALGVPFIGVLRIRFYPNDDALTSALRSGEIESVAALSPAELSSLKESAPRVVTARLPRIFAVFWNQNQAPIFAEKAVRKALDLSVSRSFIVRNALYGYAHTATSPLPSDAQTDEQRGNDDPSGREAQAKAQAIKLLDGAGWKANPKSGVRSKKDKQLAFTLVTANTPELKEVATLLKAGWEAIGARVTLRVFELGDLNQNIIRPRKYEALFFGEVVGREPDLFSFWHSSQRNDPGLNVALYTNTKTDKLLDEARRAVGAKQREQLFADVVSQISEDVPAAFVYVPEFLYLIPDRVHGIALATITTAAERFDTINTWYIETERVWKPFATYNH